jgi:hypothetical protein
MPTGSFDLRWTAGGASVIGVHNTWPNQHVWLWEAGTGTTVVVADDSYYYFTSPVSSSNLEFFHRSSSCCSAGLSSAESMIMNPETGEVWGGMWGHAAVPNATETSSAFTPDGEHIIVYDSGDFFPDRELIVIAPHPPAPA